MKKLWKRAKLLTFFAIISIIICLLRIVSMDMQEWFQYAEECFAFIYDIALAYIASYIFYLLQVYLPELSKEKEMIPILVVVQRNVQLFTIQLISLWESIYNSSIDKEDNLSRKEIWDSVRMLKAAKSIKLLENSDTVDFSLEPITWKEKIEIDGYELSKKGNEILDHRSNLLPPDVFLAINYLLNEGVMLKGVLLTIECLEKTGRLTAEYSLYDVLPVELSKDNQRDINRDIEKIYLLVEWVNNEYNYINAETNGKYEQNMYRIEFD